jgi:hypothetical protein
VSVDYTPLDEVPYENEMSWNPRRQTGRDCESYAYGHPS